MALSDLFRRLRTVLPGGTPERVVALDLGTDAVRGIRVRSRGDELALEAVRAVPVPAEEDGGIQVALRKVLGLRSGSEPVALSLRSPDTEIRKVELPPMNHRELREALPWEARRHIAGLSEDALVDAQVLGTSQDGGPMTVLLVATPRPVYEQMRESWQNAGVDPVFVDVNQLATMNAILRSTENADGRTVACVDLASHAGFFAIFSASDLILHRDLGPRLVHLDATLAREFSLGPDEVEALKRGEKMASRKMPPDDAVRSTLIDAASEIGEDLRAGRLYVENRTGGSLEHVYLTGSSGHFLDHYGITSVLGEQTGIHLERFEPFTRFQTEGVARDALDRTGADLSAPAGVAIRFLTH